MVAAKRSPFLVCFDINHAMNIIYLLCPNDNRSVLFSNRDRVAAKRFSFLVQISLFGHKSQNNFRKTSLQHFVFENVQILISQ